jgi:uncharacterized protein with beta-barrel porin domain
VSGSDIVSNVVSINFANGQSGSNAVLGGYLNQVYGSIGSPLGQNLVDITTVGALTDAYNQMAPRQIARGVATGVQAGQSFTNRLMSCSSTEGAYVFIREGQCVWAVTEAQRSTRKDTGSELGSTERATRLTAGAQFELTPDLRAGFAIGVTNSNTTTAGGQSSKGDEYTAGVSLKYNAGPMLLAAALTGSSASYQARRTVSFGALNEVAVSSPDIARIGGRVRAAYEFDFGSIYVKPLADVDLQNLMMRGTAETGSSATNLTTLASNHFIASVSPAVEVGGEIRADMMPLFFRPFIRAGVTAYSQKSFGVTAYLQNVGPDLGSFTTMSTIDPVVMDVAAGLEVLNKNGMSLKMTYEGHYGRTSRTDIAGAKFSVRF